MQVVRDPVRDGLLNLILGWIALHYRAKNPNTCHLMDADIVVCSAFYLGRFGIVYHIWAFFKGLYCFPFV
jgi:hypothetical protein